MSWVWSRTALIAGALVLAGGATAGAADLVVPGVSAADVPTVGVACEAPVVQAFPSVWLGHFTGGYSHYLGEGGPIVLDWRDEKLCFPSHASCNRYIAAMRRDFHRPEGYFTCLPIR
jgi:hypothetical protein